MNSHVVPLPDGRVLAGLTHGPEDGTPVLFIAGAASGKSMYFGKHLLAEAGIRVLTMDRPGMGESTPDPDRTLESTVADYRAFVTGVLGSEASIPVVAHSQGGVFGLGAALAGWASKLVLASPADELSYAAIHAMLPPEATALADLAATDPEEATRILRGFTPASMESMVLEGSHPHDRAFYSHPSFQPLYQQALVEGFAHEGVGYVCDTLIAMRPWDLDLESVSVPVTILFGKNDLGHSPDHGATLAGRMPHASCTLFSDAGGALLWTHDAKVIEALDL